MWHHITKGNIADNGHYEINLSNTADVERNSTLCNIASNMFQLWNMTRNAALFVQGFSLSTAIFISSFRIAVKKIFSLIYLGSQEW